MEENRFSAKVIPEKKNYKDFGRVHMKKSKASLLFLIFSIVLFALDMVLAYLNGFSELSTATVTLTYLMFFYWLFYGDFIGRASYRNINKKQQGQPLTYYFGDSSLSAYSELVSSNASYEAISDVYENDNIFVLYNSKSTGFVIPKNCFTEGTPDTFRTFITEKIGKPVKRVRTRDRLALRIVIAVLAFAVMIGSLVAVDFIRDRVSSEPAEFTTDNYSIMLTKEFEQDNDGDWDLGAFTDEAGVIVYRYTQEEISDYVGEADSAMGYLQNMAENWGLEREDVYLNMHGAACMEYISEVDGEDWYYYDVVYLKGDDLWMTEFFCPDSESDDYYDLFDNWASSITIK